MIWIALIFCVLGAIVSLKLSISWENILNLAESLREKQRR